MNRILFLFFSTFLFHSCGTSRMAYNQDMSYMYKRDAAFLHPSFRVLHTTDSTTSVFFSINSAELLYSKQPNATDYTARVVISYMLTQSYESKVILDSGTVRLTDINNDNTQKLINSALMIKTRKSTTYLLKINMYDLNRNQQSETYLDLYKTNFNSSQNFLVKNAETNGILFRDNISSEEYVTITYKHAVQNKLFVKYFKQDFPIASPPFSILDPKPFVYKPDSTFSLSLIDGISANLRLQSPGIYNFVIDTNQREGLTLYRFHDGFPEVTRVEQMIYPLRYITSKEEYENILNSKNKKLAVENFWINCAGNQDRAKEVIRKFYNRVRDANIYFSSYTEGWKTDKGMIYLIFGPPNLVYRSTDSETWVFGEDNNLNSLSFSFNKVTNPIAENDYLLQRSTIYKANWYRAVDIWRQGRIYLQN